MTRQEYRKWEEGRCQRKALFKRAFLFHISFSFILLTSRPIESAELIESRVFWADAGLSLPVPDGWTFQDAFPDEGPFLMRELDHGRTARITVERDAPDASLPITADLDPEILARAARQKALAGGSRIVARSDRTLGQRRAAEVTFLTPERDRVWQTQLVVGFMQDRLFSLHLKSLADDFPALVPGFQEWLERVRFLSRDNGGSLDAPSHGGLWIHQTGGARIAFPAIWGVGAADDRQVGAAYTDHQQEVTFTMTVGDPGVPAGEASEADRARIRKDLRSRGFRITEETDEPFHGHPSLQVAYEGAQNKRFLKGRDIWVYTPRGRWLINLQGDSRLFRERLNDFRDILDAIDFL